LATFPIQLIKAEFAEYGAGLMAVTRINERGAERCQTTDKAANECHGLRGLRRDLPIAGHGCHCLLCVLENETHHASQRQTERCASAFCYVSLNLVLHDGS
jgi:hypothetical protein